MSLSPQSWILGHPQDGLLPTLLSAPALPTEAGPVAQMCLASLLGWGVVSLGEKEGGCQLAEPGLAGGRGVRVGMLGGRRGQTPTQKVLLLLSKGKVGTPSWGRGKGDR